MSKFTYIGKRNEKPGHIIFLTIACISFLSKLYSKLTIMPSTRKRHGHHEYHKPSAIPSGQRTKGRITWAILFGIFGLLITLFASGNNYWVIGTGVLIGALIGYIVGKNMEKDASQNAK
jgi:hypothetical protein